MKKVEKCIYLLSPCESKELSTLPRAHSYGMGGMTILQIPREFFTKERFPEIFKDILKKYEIEQNERELKITASSIFDQVISYGHIAFYVCSSVCPELRDVRFIVKLNEEKIPFLIMRAKQESCYELLSGTKESIEYRKARREIYSLGKYLLDLWKVFLTP
jgi:hypothetical protein